MYEIGDALLFAVSAWRTCTWLDFRRAFDDLRTRQFAAGGGGVEAPRPADRLGAARVMEALGHCDVVFDQDGDGVFAMPSVLAPLPAYGLPRAILCGSRSPETVGTLRSAARKAGASVQVHSTQQSGLSPFAPARIEVEAASGRILSQFAEDLGISCEPVPPAWSLAVFSGSVDGLVGSLTWSTRPDLTWPRADFDPEQLRFAGRRDGDTLVLAMYLDPTRGRRRYWLWRARESAEIEDPAWGRYVVLASMGRAVLRYSPGTGELAVPAGAGLPRLIARAAALCSGYPPATIHSRNVRGSAPRWYQVYRDVPPDVYAVFEERLGQSQLG